MRVPRATVRLQMHPGFTLDDARARIPYYATLGISHFYLSPISCAVPGSQHGYDVVDPSRVSPDLGGEPALRRLARALQDRDMGILLDIVPNHMATHPGNEWWWDVLAHGMHSRYAAWFDINWHPADKSLHGKILAPFLADNYADSLARGDLRLNYDGKTDRYLIMAGAAAYPVAPGSLAGDDRNPVDVLAEYDPAFQAGQRRMHELLERQHYRLCSWRCAAKNINWRRFFEITGLIGVRVEEPEVFDAVHELPLRLYEEGLLDGLRIDHVDGLARPLTYCERLRAAMLERRPQAATPWVVVEKILAHAEPLDHRFQISGTTGYDFMDQVAAVLHDEKGCVQLVELWRQNTKNPDTAARFVLQARLLMLRRHFVAERTALTRCMHELIRGETGSDAWSMEALDRVLEAFLAGFPVYRSYIEGGEASAGDMAVIETAASEARTRLDSSEQRLLKVMVDRLTAVKQRDPDILSAAEDPVRIKVIRRFEQLTPPLAAKSLEDTVFYRYGPLLSRNEVGSDPSFLTLKVEEFHSNNTHRIKRHPASLLATASHDHKRGEDMRARLAVLSERVDAWRQACSEWETWQRTECGRPMPQAEIYMLWQTLVGAWPLDLDIRNAAAVAGFGKRIAQWQLKALREAKSSSSWLEPNLEHERDSATYLYKLLGWPTEAARRLAEAADAVAERDAVGEHVPQSGLLKSFHEFVQSIAPAGAVNGFAQLVLRLTAPGVPDLYQGTEWWDFSLVDPDNRRPVDYTARQRALESIGPEKNLASLLPHWRDGRIKQAMLCRLLELKAALPDVFNGGAYDPLEVAGVRRDRLMAFARRHNGRQVIVVAPRLCADAVSRAADARPVIDMTCWKDTGIMVAAHRGGGFKDVFSGRFFHPSDGAALKAEHLFADLPCAVLTAA
ncbi:malto-oligosyltrehalose synthase [Pusillimonas sp.]|uniref:malto-oligosyltrehalose synthase n=1 Tax=Pusillimonas sp. TaxID=3040095 RepID=UPI0037C7CD4D